jgi:isocitrate dehydrogenase
MLRHLGLMEQAIKIENALLYTLESGVHTGDFGDKNIPSVNTTVFAQAIIDNFGKEPKHNPKPLLPNFYVTPTHFKLEHNPMLQSDLNDQHKIVGVDFFIESNLQPSVIAASCLAHTTDSLKLVTITNRGTQVWPSGSIYTNLVNQYYCRFETVNEVPLTQNDVVQLYSALSKNFTICSLEILNMWADKKAYSLAQGQ